MLRAIVEKYKFYPLFYRPLNFAKSNDAIKIKPTLNNTKELYVNKNYNECLNSPSCQADLCNKCFNNKK